jgi:hypothetical protein
METLSIRIWLLMMARRRPPIISRIHVIILLTITNNKTCEPVGLALQRRKKNSKNTYVNEKVNNNSIEFDGKQYTSHGASMPMREVLIVLVSVKFLPPGAHK